MTAAFIIYMYMRKYIVILLLLCMSTMSCYAQLYYFVKAGTELSSSTSVMLIYISGGKMYTTSKSASEISSKLNSNSSYWRNWMSEKLRNDDEPYEYDSQLTTSKYTVYKSTWRGDPQANFTPGWGGGSWSWSKGSLIGSYYRALSSDASTLITWRQRKNSDVVDNKVYWEVVDVSILNKDPHDFLH